MHYDVPLPADIEVWQGWWAQVATHCVGAVTVVHACTCVRVFARGRCLLVCCEGASRVGMRELFHVAALPGLSPVPKDGLLQSRDLLSDVRVADAASVK